MTLTQRTHETPHGSVSAVRLPTDARALSTLSRIDYEDAFRLDAGVDRPAEQWVRAMLTDAPLTVRSRLVASWLALGLNLRGPWAPQRVLGWNVHYRDADVVLLAADSWLGLRGQLLFRREPRGLLFATLIQLNNPLVRVLWVAITEKHQHVVRSLLRHAGCREQSIRRTGEPALDDHATIHHTARESVNTLVLEREGTWSDAGLTRSGRGDERALVHWAGNGLGRSPQERS